MIDGAERRLNRWWLWWPLLGLAAWLAFGGEPVEHEMARSIPVRAHAPARENRAAEPSRSAAGREALVALVPREQLIVRSNSNSAERPLFSARAWNPPPAPAIPPPAPSAPALPYTFLGKKHESGVWEIYLARGEQSFIAREGQVLEGTYRVDAIAPPSLKLTYLPLNQAQTLAIGDTR
jgi:hypothetical protein